MTRFPYYALIPAAGIGARMGAALPKQYLPLAGVPMLRRTVDAFLACPAIRHTFVVVSAEDAYAEDAIPAGLAGVTLLRCGGATRKESVMQGLQAMQGQVADSDWVLVHDAARPGLTPALIDKLIREVTQAGLDASGGLLGLPVVDTVKQRTADALRTIPREALWLAQTPQMFRLGHLYQALLQTRALDGITDEASALEHATSPTAARPPIMVEGHPCNLKVTLPSDILVAEMYLEWAGRLT